MRVSRRMPLFGSVNPTASNSAEQPLRQAEPEEEPDDRGEDAHHERLEHDRQPHLAPRRAERPQRGELARPLRDRDRQRVDDDERADEERDQSEGEQEVAEERDELVGVLRVLAAPGRRRCAPRCSAAGSRGSARSSFCGRDARLRGDADLVELALLAEEPLRRRADRSRRASRRRSSSPSRT